MSNFSGYKTKQFSETQKFFVLDPQTGSPSFVTGSDLVKQLTPNANYVFSESTRTTAEATDYPIGSLVETAGATTAGDNFAAVYLVVAAGEGDFPMDNGNELLVIRGDEFLREQIAQNTTGQGSDLIAHTGTTDTVTEALDKRTIYVGSVAELRNLSDLTTPVEVAGYYAPGDGGGGPLRVWKTGDVGEFVDNGGSVIVPTGGDGSGAWVWEWSGPVDIKWIGVQEDSATAADIINEGFSDHEYIVLVNNYKTLRVDGMIVVPNNKEFINNGGLYRYDTTPSLTGPIVNVRGNYSKFSGGFIKTYNDHPEGIVTLGHHDFDVTYNSLYWKFQNVRLNGKSTIADGNIGIRVISAQPISGANAANYFGLIENIMLRYADIGIQLTEICNAHQIFNINFWQCKTAAYQFRGAYENSIFGGFVHTGAGPVIGIQLLNRTTGPHDSVGNMFYGVGIEPATSGSSTYYIDTNCARNTLQVFGNAPGGNTLLNTDNDIRTGFATNFLSFKRGIATGDISSDGRITANEASIGTKHTVSASADVLEGDTVDIFAVNPSASRSALITLDVSGYNTNIDRRSSWRKVFSVTRDNANNRTVTELSSLNNSPAWITGVDISGTTLQLTFHNNGTGTTGNYAWTAEVSAMTPSEAEKLITSPV